LRATGVRCLLTGGRGFGLGVEKCLKMAQNPQRQVHALLAAFFLIVLN
jgi:hypothetical protein